MSAKRIARPDRVEAAKKLAALWDNVSADFEKSEDIQYLDDTEIREKISLCVNNDQVGVRYCLPIQIAGKYTDGDLDATALQAEPTEGAWDARSFASQVVAPFLNSKNGVLGLSNDPYVGNPYRVPRIERDQAGIKDKESRNIALDVLEFVQNADHEETTKKALSQVLLEILRRLRRMTFAYILPPRVSLEKALKLCDIFLSVPSGGERGLSVTAALFKVMGLRFGLFSDVHRRVINAADKATGMAGDLECVDADGNTVILVEVKERELSFADVESAIQKARDAQISELFLTAQGVNKEDIERVFARIASAFTGGQNVYVTSIPILANTILSIGGEELRTAFLKEVGIQLDTFNTQPKHREAWKNLLEAL